MKKFTNSALLAGIVSILTLGFLTAVVGQPVDDELVLNEEIEITTEAPLPAHLEDTPLDALYSGWRFRTDETREIQRDDFENPAIIGVEEAAVDWAMVEGSEGKSCAECHGDPESMAGLRAEVPKVNDEGKLFTLEDFVNQCRTERMGAEAWGWNSNKMINMTALISSVSRGMPMNVQIDGPAREFWEKGKELYYARTGQLEFSCATCHEVNYGQRIRSDHLSQGHINGFPTYRLKNAKLNSIHARFRGCVRDTRAETYPVGSDEFRWLELYVSSRGNGLSVEAPAVRN